MAKQAVKTTKAGTPEAVKAKPSLPLVMPSAKAITADAGIKALRMIAQAKTNEEQINALRAQNAELIDSKRGKAQVLLALAIYQAGIVDPDFRADLPKIWSDSKSDTIYVGKRVRMAIGLIKSTDGVETDEARAIQSSTGSDTEADKKRKESIRANFATTLTKSIKVALHALDNGIVMEQDKATGLMRITDGRRSDAVKKHFGEASVVLNEDQNFQVKDKKGQITGTKTLKAKPSFTEVMREAGSAHGKAVVSRDTRTKVKSNDEHVIDLSESLKTAVTKWTGDVPEPVRKALEALVNAIEKRLS